VLTFLGKVIGLGNFGGRIKATVMKMRARLDAVVDKIIVRVKGLIGRVTGKGNPVAVKDKPGVKPATKDDSVNTKKSLDIKTKVRQELAVALPKTFEKPEQIRGPLKTVFRNNKSQGLKGLKAQYKNKNLGEFEVMAKASPYEKVAYTKALIRFESADFKRLISQVTLYAIVDGKSLKFTSDSNGHAEQNFISFANANWDDLCVNGKSPDISIQLTSSMCGIDHKDAKCQDCAGNIQRWAASKKIHINVDILGVYQGRHNKVSMAALQKIIDDPNSGITLRTWEVNGAIAQLRSLLGDEFTPDMERRITSKLVNSKKALEELSREELK
jgi:hypothetical protein